MKKHFGAWALSLILALTMLVPTAFAQIPVDESKIAPEAKGYAFVQGFQGDLDDSSDYLKAIACIKHFAANNAEGVRSNGSSNMSEAELSRFG